MTRYPKDQKDPNPEKQKTELIRILEKPTVSEKPKNIQIQKNKKIRIQEKQKNRILENQKDPTK